MDYDKSLEHEAEIDVTCQRASSTNPSSTIIH
jgi:hypothetical protein